MLPEDWARGEFRYELRGDEPLDWLAQELRQAKRMFALGVGFACSRTRSYSLFESLMGHGEEARPYLRELLAQGSPAARLYAAVGLTYLDEAEGRQALTSLLKDEEEVVTMCGCGGELCTVGGYARQLLDDPREHRIYLAPWMREKKGGPVPPDHGIG